MSLVQLELTQAAQVFLHVLHVAQATTKARQEDLLAALVLPARISHLRVRLRVVLAQSDISLAPQLFPHVRLVPLAIIKAPLVRQIVLPVLLELIKLSRVRLPAALVQSGITEALRLSPHVRLAPLAIINQLHPKLLALLVLLVLINRFQVKAHALLVSLELTKTYQDLPHAFHVLLAIIRVPAAKPAASRVL